MWPLPRVLCARVVEFIYQPASSRRIANAVSARIIALDVQLARPIYLVDLLGCFFTVPCAVRVFAEDNFEQSQESARKQERAVPQGT